MTSQSFDPRKAFAACWSSQNVCPIHSLGAVGETESILARLRESPDA